MNPATSDAGPTADPALPRGFRIGVILAVCAVNLVILGYAISQALPHGSAQPHVRTGVGPPVVAAAAPAPAPDAAPVVAAPPPSTPPPTSPVGQASATPAVVNPVILPDAAIVRGAYIQHCSACHGADGRGDGPAAAQTYPRPRDFVASPFRYASTNGTREEVITALEKIIAVGVPRSAMPGFEGVLDESMIAGLARHVLDQRTAAGPPTAPPIDVGVRPPTTAGLIARGAELYKTQGCITCHGASGHGDGELARSLVDSIGRPVRAADLASGVFKSGQGPADLCRSILVGVPGTPMIGYEPALTRTNADGTRDLTDAWALVAYIQSFSPRDIPIGHTSGASLSSLRVEDESMLDDPTHPGWLGVPAVGIELRPLWQRVETITHLDVRVVHTNRQIAVALDWRDPTLDRGVDSGVFPDAVAVMYSMSGDVPALPMGVHIEGFRAQAPVNLWHWKASRQPGPDNPLNDPAPPSESGPTRGWTVFPKDAQPATEDVTDAAGLPETRAAREAANVRDDPALRARSVLESNAEGFGTLRLQPASSQHVRATAAWSHGLWRVVMVRDIRTGDADDVDFTRLSRIPMTFAVWDGSKGDRNGIKLISGWHWLTPGPVAADASQGAEQ
ncbi:MAG: c-type cytochrome [Planctomycetia bacterium]|nr:MAG: c-type cytochrome [Planctomycetia bacterium]